MNKNYAYLEDLIRENILTAESLLIILGNYFSSDELEDFVEYVKEEI